MIRRSPLALFLAAALAACGGTPNTPSGSVVNYPGGGGSPAPRLIDAALFVSVPHGKAAGRRADYLSTRTGSVVVELASVDGTGISNATATTLDVGAHAPGCKEFAASIQCHGIVEALPGEDVFNVSTFAGPAGEGPVLSSGQVQAAIGGGGNVRITNLSLALQGLIASLRLKITPAESNVGKPATAQVLMTAYDSAGAAIAGPSDYASNVALSIQGDSVKAFQLRSGGTTGTTIVVRKPGQPIELSYDGNNGAATITLQATASGSSAATATATYTLKGTAPPPVASEIFVLNAGANSGLGATVTVYDATAKGNVAPKRTLTLASKLYAQSIALDAQQRLYVGYFDSTLGASIVNGTPDQANEVAVYAAGASGTAKPVATIVASGGSGTLVYPAAMAFDKNGDLVTYGATRVDGNQGNDSVLIYAPGATGAATPANAWGFFSPFFHYPGPTGIALDASGNFYVGGTLKTSLSPVSGVFVAPAADSSKPNVNPARTLPWDTGTKLVAGQASTIGLDAAGEILIANFVRSGTAVCQAQVSVYSAGATGGTTDTPPLRVASINGFTAKTATCQSAGDYLAAHFPALDLFGSYVYAGDDFNNAIVVFPVTASGNVSPPQVIGGSATALNAPIGIAVAPSASPSPLPQDSARAGHVRYSSQGTPR